MLLTSAATAQTPTGDQPRAGGTLRIGDWSEPATLNPYFSGSTLSAVLSELALDGLARVTPDGSYVPDLAAQIPTQANGDVSPDGTVVTWKLKHGITWSDGQPFTSQDVVYTYEMLIDPANPVLNRSDYAAMQSVTAPAEDTVIVTYKRLYPPYRLAFPWVFPSHVFNGESNISQDPFNRAETVGTGPFLFKSWVSGDTITFDRNASYREPGRPYLDEVIAKIVPSRDAEIQALEAGDIDVAYFLDPSYLSQLARLQDVSVDPGPYGVTDLFVNASCPTGPQQGDPACPHPVLGDVRVRQAIELAIDKQALVHALMGDRVNVAVSPMLSTTGPYAVDLPPSEFSPDAADSLLDQAGWITGSDGIRSKAGVRAQLSIINAVGDIISEEAAQAIAADLQAIGIAVDNKEMTPTVISGGIATNSPLYLGSFDLLLFTRTVRGDPLPYLRAQYASDQVPTAQAPSGQNWDRVQDPQLDQALDSAGGTLDDTQRQAAFVSVSRLVRADEAAIPLFPWLIVDARKSYVAGWGPTNVNDWVTWNAQDWWLNQ